VGVSVPGSSLFERDAFLLVDIDRFQGPLDLLLHLIRQQDIDIFDIPIARITDQFLKAVEKIGVDELEGAGEFLEMAATLVRIKAQMLLPRHDDDEDDDPRAELVRRLLEYEQIREIATRLSSSEAERARRFGRGYVPPRPKLQLSDTPLETTWDEVYKAALGVTMPEPKDRLHSVTTRPVAMEDKIDLILVTLRDAARVEFSRLLSGIEGLGAKMHGVMTFLACLELGRRRIVILRQVQPFTEVWLHRLEREVVEAAMEAEAARLSGELDREDVGVDEIEDDWQRGGEPVFRAREELPTDREAELEAEKILDEALAAQRGDANGTEPSNSQNDSGDSE
jgi:segregation and condensation protein A